jgi:hypothetical protein
MPSVDSTGGIFLCPQKKGSNDMAKIQFYNGWDWDHHPQALPVPVIRVETVYEGLNRLIDEWQEATGNNLESAQAPVTLMIDDFLAILGLQRIFKESDNK